MLGYAVIFCAGEIEMIVASGEVPATFTNSCIRGDLARRRAL